MLFESKYLESVFSALADKGFKIGPGLTDSELDAAQTYWKFTFPPDWKQVIQYAYPVADIFPDWREPDSEDMCGRISGPYDGMCFDIDNNAFWMDVWGERPEDQNDAKEIAKKAVDQAPFLIPVYSHRYIPASPGTKGNPIFSVHQTDIIYYGFDIAHYFMNEFRITNPYTVPNEPRQINFWCDICG